MRILRAPSAWALLVVLAGGWLLGQWVRSVGGPEGIHARFGAAAPVVTGGLQLALTPTLFPTDLLCIAHGTLYGFLLAAPLNWLAWWLAALVEYGLGRRARSDLALEARLRRLPGWLRRYPVDHPVFLIAARQLPWVGGHLTTFVPGALGVPFPRVAWCSAVAVVPGAVLLAALGAGLLALG